MKIKRVIVFVVLSLLLIISVNATAPSITSIVINSTQPTTNNTHQNITTTVISSDDDGDSVKLIYNWYVNGTSITVLNMPFEKINGTNSNNAWDYSGYGNNGDVSSATWNSTGGFDGKGAYEFNGSDFPINEVIIIQDATSLNHANKISIQAWIKPNNVGNDWETIVMKGSSQSLGQNRFSYNLRLNEKGEPSFSINLSGGTGWKYATGSTLQNKSWYHIVGTYDGNHVKLYVNGSLVKTSSPVSGDITLGSDDIRIGEIGNDDFNGTIDDIIIFNRSLSAEQVFLLYNNLSGIIGANETKINDYWNVSVTPNDGNTDGTLVWSKFILITNTLISEGSSSVPEWDSYAVFLILLVVISGFFQIKKRE